MKMLRLSVFLFVILLPTTLMAQEELKSKKISEAIKKAKINELETKKYFEEHNWSLIPNEKTSIYGLVNGIPAIVSTMDVGQRNSGNVDRLTDGTLPSINADGNGMEIYVWDGINRRVMREHEDLDGRVTNLQSALSIGAHNSAVAGVIMASGEFNGNAIGIAPNAMLKDYDLADDTIEMRAEAASNSDYMVSNHAYGFSTGWFRSSNIIVDGETVPEDSWFWFGDPSIDDEESSFFGFYNEMDQAYDEIAFDYPQYTIVKSAGNDADDLGPGSGVDHFVWDLDSNQWIAGNPSSVPGPDCPNGFNCLIWSSIAKNLIIVGANLPLATTNNRYTDANDVVRTNFSSAGPTDDGRIKPDITYTGQNVLTIDSNTTNNYRNWSGTSFSAPGVAGIVLLLQQIYHQFNSDYMNSDLVRALISHTANEAGSNPGPDYIFGWGLIDALGGAQVLVDASNGDNSYIQNNTLNNGSTYTFQVTAVDGEPLKATLAWIDPAFDSNSAETFLYGPDSPMNRTPVLVNDLDLRILDSSNNQTMPWTLDLTNPAAAAAPGDNLVDNIEQVVIENPTAGATYSIRVSHKGTLLNNQNYALIITGGEEVELSTVNPSTKNSIKIYPNPTTNFINVEFNEDWKGDVVKVQIIDAKGALISTDSFIANNNKQIEVSKLPSGIYTILLNSEKGSINKRFIKQ